MPGVTFRDHPLIINLGADGAVVAVDGEAYAEL